MAVSTTCPAPMESQYRSLLDKLHISVDEAARVLPLIHDLDGLDGTCDGQLSPIKYDDLKSAADKIAALNLSPLRKVEIRNAISALLIKNNFSEFTSRPYHELTLFLLKNPMFVDSVLPYIQPRDFWTEEFASMLRVIQGAPQEFSVNYQQLVYKLYERSGLSNLHALIDKAEQVRIREAVDRPDTVSVMTGKKVQNTSTSKLMGVFDLPQFPDLMRVNPAALPELLRQKDRAESEFVATLLNKIDAFPDELKKDPLTYWMPLVVLATAEPDAIEKTAPHYQTLRLLYTKANALAFDNVMRALFAVEFAEYSGDPMGVAALDQQIAAIRREISIVSQPEYRLPNGTTETNQERVGRYYSAIGHLFTRKYAIAISSMSPNPILIAKIEADIEALLQERRDKTTVDEALVYADTMTIMASAWAADGGLMTQKLMVEGLPKAREALARLTLFQKRFETLCNGHVLHPAQGRLLREKMASVRWKFLGEAYFRAGLPKDGLTNLDSEPFKFQNTAAYSEHVKNLARQFPWLVDQRGKITLANVGRHGEDAESVTQTIFYSSQDTGREVGLPIVGAAIGSLGGPLGSFAGGYAGKTINRVVNVNSADAREVLSQARETGIPLISENLSEQLAHAEHIDIATCGVSSLLMFRFYRAGLSLSRASAQASLQYVTNGGLRATAQASLKQLAPASLKVTGRQLATDAVVGVKNLPSAVSAIPGRVIQDYGKTGAWPFVKFMWANYGVHIRLTTSAALMAADYAPDREFNTWTGPLGASLLINDVYGKLIWGWNPNGGMVGFAWRYGFELGVQAMQGISISKPRMDYTVAGMLSAYTLRGINKVYTIGRADTCSSPVMQRLAHFVEEHDVHVPRSVTGMTRIKASWGMVRGWAMRIGKPPIPLSADLPDGTILRVHEAKKTTKEYVVHVVRKMTTPKGKPVAVVTEQLPGAVAEVTEVMTLPRASAMGRWWYRTVYERLADATVYRVPDKILKWLKVQPQWWVDLGQRTSTASKPIFNFRGSIANAGDLPIIALVGGGFGVLQDSDPTMTGLYRAADYGVAFFLQHKVQHLFKIDSAAGTAVGYALGIPSSILSLPLIFPTVINKAPGLTKEKEGYFDRLSVGDDEGANQALQGAVTSLCPVANAPIIGHHFWNHVTPFGAVEGSYHRIEEVGAVAYWRKMVQKMQESRDNNNARLVMERFIDKVARDSHRYLVAHDLPEDPVRLRLLVLELALVKRFLQDKTFPDLMRHANSYAILKAATAQVPMIRTENDLKRFVTGLNVDDVVGVVASTN